MKEIRHTGVSLLTLLFSLSTLICCVLPILFVGLGLGTVLAALISQFPILITLSDHKLLLFVISGSLLLLSAWLVWYSSHSCPSDIQKAALCVRIQTWNKRIWWVALIIWLIGFIVTYIILPLWVWMVS